MKKITLLMLCLFIITIPASALSIADILGEYDAYVDISYIDTETLNQADDFNEEMLRDTFGGDFNFIIKEVDNSLRIYITSNNFEDPVITEGTLKGDSLSFKLYLDEAVYFTYTGTFNSNGTNLNGTMELISPLGSLVDGYFSMDKKSDSVNIDSDDGEEMTKPDNKKAEDQNPEDEEIPSEDTEKDDNADKDPPKDSSKDVREDDNVQNNVLDPDDYTLEDIYSIFDINIKEEDLNKEVKYEYKSPEQTELPEVEDPLDITNRLKKVVADTGSEYITKKLSGIKDTTNMIRVFKISDTEQTYEDRKALVDFTSMGLDKIAEYAGPMGFLVEGLKRKADSNLKTTEDKAKDTAKKLGVSIKEASLSNDMNPYDKRVEKTALTKDVILSQSNPVVKVVSNVLEKAGNTKRKAYAKALGKEYNIYKEAYKKAKDKGLINKKAIAEADEAINKYNKEKLGQTFLDKQEDGKNKTFITHFTDFLSDKILDQEPGEYQNFKKRKVKYISYMIDDGVWRKGE